MNPQLEKLVLLQKIDLELLDLKKNLETVPRQIESATRELEEKKKALKEAMDGIDSLKKQRQKLEQEVQTENDHMAKVKLKLPSVKTNKEYSAILHEVEAVKEKVGKLEDQELDVMESLESLEEKLPGIRARFKEEEEKFRDYKTRKDQETKRVEKEIEEVRTRREAIAGSVEPKWVRRYSQVGHQRGQESVVVPLEGDSCQGCHQIILPQLVIEIKMGEKLFDCPHCNRILYWEAQPDNQPETETVLPK